MRKSTNFIVKPVLLAVSLALTGPSLSIAAEANQVNVNIEANKLSKALNQLAAQTGAIIIAPGRLVSPFQAKNIRGAMPLEAALEQLLKGTGLTAENQGQQTFVIKKQLAGQSSAKTNTRLTPMDEVVVSVTKKDSSLMDVAASVALLDAEQIRAQGVTDFSSLVDTMPGISINSAFGGPQNSFLTIRGIGGADDYKPNGNPSVALHVDGIYQSSNAYLGMPLFDLERVEVLKGPQGTLYGRNTTAGAINAVTRLPGEAFDGYTSVEYGSYEYSKAEAAFGGAVADNLKVRLAVLTEQGGGYMQGMGAGSFAGYTPDGYADVIPAVTEPGSRDGFGDKDTFAMRATAVYSFNAQTDLVLRYFNSRDRGDTLQYDRVALANDPIASRNAGEDSDPYSFYSDEYYRHSIDISGFNGELKHQIRENLKLNILFGLQESERDVAGNGDGTSYPRYKYQFDEKLDQSTFEMRLSDSQGGQFDWLAGVFYVSDAVDFTSNWHSLGVLSEYTSPYQQSRNSFAAFANGDWFVNNDLVLSAGLRFTQDSVKFSGYNEDLDPWGTSTYSDVFGSPGYFSWDKSFDDQNLSAKLTAKYYLNDNLNLFASIGNGYRGGGFDGTSIFTPEETEPFESEEVLAYEAGLRYADDAFNMSFDVFAYNFEELQATARLANDTNGRTNVGKAEVKGAEISLSYSLLASATQQLSINASATYLDTEITEFESNRINDVEATIGDQLPGSPKFSYQLSVLHEVALGEGDYLVSRLSYNHHGEESNRLNASDSNTVPDYALLNLNLDWEMSSGITLFAYGRNITDEVYFLEYNSGSRLVGAPATYGLGFRLDY